MQITPNRRREGGVKKGSFLGVDLGYGAYDFERSGLGAESAAFSENRFFSLR